MKLKIVIWFLVGLLFCGKTVTAQNISNEGTDFWAVFPTHVPSGNALAAMTIFISSKENSSGNVIVGGTPYPFTVLANTIARVPVVRSQAYIGDLEANTVVSNKGIHIVVDKGKPKVAAYAHIYARARSEAYLILPVEALGKKYYSMNTTGVSAQNGNGVVGSPFLAIVATEDETTVTIKRKTGFPLEQKVTLPKAGDVYEVLTTSDLSGTSVELDETTSSCKTFAVYSGHSGIAIDANSADPMAQQLYPIKSWGRVYGVVPFSQRKHFIKIIASEDNTNVKINGVQTATLNQGDIFSSSYETTFQLVEADRPISVAQFTISQDVIAANGRLLGDPEMVMLNPIEYSIKNITVFSSNLENIVEKYVNVFMRTNYIKSFKINGAAPKSLWQTVPGYPEYSFIQEQVYAESLTLTADDNFNAMAYGFGDHESYAYSAGTNLASNQFLQLVNKISHQETQAACLGQPSDFKLTLPYVLTQITWRREDGTLLFDDPSPMPSSSVVNGQTLYSYDAPVNQIFSTLGQVKFSATGTVAQSAENCFSGELNLNFLVDVDPLPTAEFSSAAAGCVRQEIQFTDKSLSNAEGKIVKKWFWDFGDGETSTEQNPKHSFKKDGKLTVNLYVAGESGCYSDVISHPVLIYPEITASFQANEKTCINTDVTFTDQSKIESGTIVKWTWDFGDGTKEDKTSASPFAHKYQSVGEYTISLFAESDKGCVSLTFSKKIAVVDLPVVDFSSPSFCLADVNATFTNKSTDPNGEESQFTYLWDFDDPTTGILNSSTAKDPSHQYTKVGNYQVKLTVFTKNGCAVTKELTFTVNGSNPKADFQQLEEESCSNTAFTVKNVSNVASFGSVTKIEWYINGVLDTVDNSPKFGSLYSFNYPPFSSPATVSIKLKMVAYSGGLCKDEMEQMVVLKASPIVEFNQLAAVCLNEGIIKIEAIELGKLAGKGIFSGSGISSDGYFNPLVAGTGVHDITYTFIADNGCSASKVQNIEVYPLPTVNAGDDLYILAGGEKRFMATGSGRGLKYKWSPAIGLDHDDVLNPIARPETDTEYTLTITSDQGCSVKDRVMVHVLQSVSAPNAFTPNGDGVNDVWNVQYLDSYPNVTVEIFNRNGARVFYSRNYTVPFDGNFENQALPVGTYYYIINPNSGRKRITGNLTIIR